MSKRGTHFSDDLKASPMDQPIRCQDAPPVNAPKTPKEPSVQFADPPKSTKAGLPPETESPEEEAAETPAYEASEKKDEY